MNTPATKRVDGIRVQIGKTKAALEKLDAARLDLESTQAKVTRELDSVGTLGVGDFDLEVSGFSQQQNEPPDWRRPILLCDLLQILGRPAIEDYIRRVNAPFTEQGLPATEIVEQRKTLSAQLRQLERDEEMEILRLEAAGVSVARRGDISGALLLEIWNNEDNTERTEP